MNSPEDTQKAEPLSAENGGHTGISVRNLTVKAGARTLLENADAEFEGGKITMVVGPSGVGKSILMRIVAGLLGKSGHEGISYHGEVLVEKQQIEPGKVGVVFQSFALFDELSPRANVQFAQDHSREKSGSIDELMKALNIPKDVPTSRLSGGQRQRLAIARVGTNPL